MAQTEKSNNRLRIALIIMAALVIIITVTVTAIQLTGSSATQRHFEKQLSLGDKYLAEMNYEKAIAAFSKAIEIDPKNMDAYIGLAEAYAESGDISQAMEVLDVAERRIKKAKGDDLTKAEKRKLEKEIEKLAKSVTVGIDEPLNDEEENKPDKPLNDEEEEKPDKPVIETVKDVDKEKIWVCTSKLATKNDHGISYKDIKTVYEYDSKGNNTKTSVYIGDKLSSEETSFYDEKGNKIKTVGYTAPDDRFDGTLGEEFTSTTEYTYNDKNQMVAQYSSNDSENEINQTWGNTTILYEYNARGLQTAMKVQDASGNSSGMIDYQYDGDGYLVSAVGGLYKYDNDNLGFPEYEYQNNSAVRNVHDNFGNVTLYHDFSRGRKDVIYQNYYDAYGHLIKTVFEDNYTETTEYTYVTLADYLDGILAYPEGSFPAGSEEMQKAITEYAKEPILSFQYEDFDGDDEYEMIALGEIRTGDTGSIANLYLYNEGSVSKKLEAEFHAEVGEGKDALYEKAYVSRLKEKNLFSIRLVGWGSFDFHYYLDSKGNMKHLEMKNEIRTRLDGNTYIIRRLDEDHIERAYDYEEARNPWKKIVHWENDGLVEYPLIKMKESDFMKYSNAQEILDGIIPEFEKEVKKDKGLGVYEPHLQFTASKAEPCGFFISDAGYCYVNYLLEGKRSGTTETQNNESIEISAEYLVMDTELVLLEINYVPMIEGLQGK